MPAGANSPQLPADLPIPVDDAAAAHLARVRWPALLLPGTDGAEHSLVDLSGITIVYAYPRTGRPGQATLVPNWPEIPGAYGCTVENTGFRDAFPRFQAANVRVFGLSTQSPAEQQEAQHRLGLPYPLLSDQDLRLASALRLPTFVAAGLTLFKRFTLAIEDGAIRRVWYPVFPPDTHAERVLADLADRRSSIGTDGRALPGGSPA
jgi:peroxiredoxin